MFETKNNKRGNIYIFISQSTHTKQLADARLVVRGSVWIYTATFDNAQLTHKCVALKQKQLNKVEKKGHKQKKI